MQIGSGLIIAVESSDVSKVKAALSAIKILAEASAQNPADLINQPVVTGSTALTAVFKVSDPNIRSEILTELLNAGANPRVKDSVGNTPAVYAAQNGDMATLKQLWQSTLGGVDIFLDRDLKGKTPFMHAVLSKNSEVVPFILSCYEAKEAKEAKEELGLTSTPISPAADKQKLTSMLSIVDHDGNSALKHSVKLGANEITHKLLKAGANINEDWIGFQYPLVAQAMEAKETLLQQLIQYGANIDTAGFNGTTALMAAIQAARVNSMVLLLAAIPDLTKRDNLKNTALHFLIINRAAYYYDGAQKAAAKFFTQLAALTPALTDVIFTEKNLKKSGTLYFRDKSPLNLLQELRSEDPVEEEFFLALITPFCEAKLRNDKLLARFMTIAVSKLYLKAAKSLHEVGCTLPEIKSIPHALDQGKSAAFATWLKELQKTPAIEPKTVKAPEEKHKVKDNKTEAEVKDLKDKILTGGKTLKGDREKQAANDPSRSRSISIANLLSRKSTVSPVNKLDNPQNKTLKEIVEKKDITDLEKIEQITQFILEANTSFNAVDSQLLLQAASLIINYEVNLVGNKYPARSANIIRKLKEVGADVFRQVDAEGSILHRVVRGKNLEAILYLIKALDLAPHTMSTAVDKYNRTVVDVCIDGEVLQELNKRKNKSDLLDLVFYLKNQLLIQNKTDFAQKLNVFHEIVKLFAHPSDVNNNSGTAIASSSHTITQLLSTGAFVLAGKVFKGMLNEIKASFPDYILAGTLQSQKVFLQEQYKQVISYLQSYPDIAQELGIAVLLKQTTSDREAKQVNNTPPPTSAGTAALQNAGTAPFPTTVAEATAGEQQSETNPQSAPTTAAVKFPTVQPEPRIILTNS